MVKVKILGSAGKCAGTVASDQEDHDTRIRILMLGLLGLLMSVKSDRYFPLPESLPEPVFQLVLFPYTLCFLFCILVFLKPCIIPATPGSFSRLSPLRLAAVIAICFEGMTFLLLVIQDMRYASFGYEVDLPIILILFTLTGIALALVFFRDGSAPLLLGISLVAFAMTSLVSIFSFPLHPGRSDMLPLIVEGCTSFLSGMTPYGFYDIPHHLVFTYLPGMWLPYVPAVALQLDPRLVSLSCIVVSVLIIAFFTREQGGRSCLLLPVFLLTPYLQYRHEIYLGVLFLVLSIVFVLFLRSRWLMGSAVFGYALATYQFTWVIFPFALVSIYRSSGGARMVLSLVVGTAVALALILPFLVASPGAFLEGIYGHWQYVDVPTVNLSYLVSFFLPWDYLFIVQGIIVLLLLGLAVRKMAPCDRWGWMAGVLVLFIALNRVIEVYFYLLVLLLLVFHGIVSAGRHAGYDCPDRGDTPIAP